MASADRQLMTVLKLGACAPLSAVKISHGKKPADTDAGLVARYTVFQYVMAAFGTLIFLVEFRIRKRDHFVSAANEHWTHCTLSQA